MSGAARTTKAGRVVLISEDGFRKKTVTLGRSRAAAAEEPAAQTRSQLAATRRTAPSWQQAVRNHLALAHRRQ